MSSAEESLQRRRAEDRQASAILGASTVYFDFLDCMYRQAADGEWPYATVFDSVHPMDAGLAAQIAEKISARLRPDDRLVCQLGIGGHVDHVLVRRAVELVARPMLYVPDIPYVLKEPGQLAQYTQRMDSVVEPVSGAGLVAWQVGIEAYRTQLSGLFESPREMRDSIRDYWSRERGIRLWQMPEPF